jgi:hypothetical protein
MWELFELQMAMTGKLCGSVPLAKELIRPWLEARAPNTKPDSGPSLPELEEDVLATIEAVEERTTLGFQQDEKGLFMRAGTVKSHLKDCSNQIRDYLNVSALRSKLANRVFVEPDPIYIETNGGIAQAADGEFERAVHVITNQGPRNALKKIRYIEKPTLTCTLRVLEGPWKRTEGKSLSTQEVLQAILEYGGFHGYSGERSMGEGRYTHTLRAV